MEKSFYFSDLSLDRAHHRRSDPDWINQARELAHAHVALVWRDRNLIRPGDPPNAVFINGAEAARLLDAASEIAFLGETEGAAYFVTDLSHLEDPAEADLPADASFEDLRRHAALMHPEEAGILAYGRGLMYWHRHHRFCGACGSPTVSDQAGHVRKCTNEACGRTHFPRTDPAVIMLITRDTPDGEVCLLGHNAAFKGRGLRFSTLAGFVEPGETLEAAVAREVYEETAVEVADVTYQASQPWPFPASLMLGFRGKATSEEITIDNEEIIDARWFSRAEVRALAEQEGTLPPPGLSISRWLIDTWLDEEE